MMQNILPACTLENRNPIWKVENDCILNKFGDITVAYSLSLPQVYSLSDKEYQSLHTLWRNIITLLPNHCVFHKQDWFTNEHYTPTYNEDSNFLQSAFERHHIERPYMQHHSYLFLSQSSKKNLRKQSPYTALAKGRIVPKEFLNTDLLDRFFEACQQIETLTNQSGLIQIKQLQTKDIIGDTSQAGLLDKYISLSQKTEPALQDIAFMPEGVRIGEKQVCIESLCDLEELAYSVPTDQRFEPYSTQNSEYKLGYSAPVGILLNGNHIYNQYLFIDDHQRNLKKLDAMCKRMNSFAKFSRANEVNKEHIDKYLYQAHEHGYKSVRAHFNVIGWAENETQLRKIKNNIGAGFIKMGGRSRRNIIDAPMLFWAGMPGNSADFPSEDSFYTFVEPAACFISHESTTKNALSPFGIKLVDRLNGQAIHVDISDEPMLKRWISNRNKFIIGPSGSGKSFFTNHMVRQYYAQGAHIVLVDIGNSYKNLCTLIHEQSGAKDGIYYTYTPEKPISFNPFFTADKKYDIEKIESILTLLACLWKNENELPSKSETVALSNAINGFIKKIQREDPIHVAFNGFYDYMKTEYREILLKKKVREKEFDLENFLNVMEPFYIGGVYDYLLNDESQINLTDKRFVVFELDNIKDNKVLFPVVTLIIMETYLAKIRNLQGVRKMILIEEAWKAIAQKGMADYIKYLFKTVRKFFGEAIIVTQEMDDIIHSEIVKNTILNNADCKILFDQRKYANKFDEIQVLLGLTEKQKSQILSLNRNNHPNRNYREVFIDLGGAFSAVYGNEVSLEEYYTYTTEEKEKKIVTDLYKQYGNMELAIRLAAEKKRSHDA